MYPTISENAKNATILRRTTATLTVGSARLVTIVSATMPRISSIIAAPNIAFPERVFNFPISLSVSTVILTDVAVSITPTNTF